MNITRKIITTLLLISTIIAGSSLFTVQASTKDLYIEKEVKFKVTDVNRLIKKLKDSNAKFIGMAEEKTSRYDDKDDSYRKRKLFFRLRSGLDNVITLKEDVINDKETTKIAKKVETETTIGDLDKLTYILKKLGLEEKKTMVKYRMKWTLNNTEVTVDELPFGIYAEIEGECEDILETAKILDFNLNDKILVTYWELFDDYKKDHEVSDRENIVFPKNHKYKLCKDLLK